MSIRPAQGILLTLRQGSTLDRTWTFHDSAGAVRDLTNYTAAMQVRRDYDPASPALLSLVNIVSIGSPPSADGLVLGGALGTLRLYVRDQTTAAISLDGFRQSCEDGEITGHGVWDLELTNADAETSRYIMGPVEFSPEVTR